MVGHQASGWDSGDAQHMGGLLRRRPQAVHAGGYRALGDARAGLARGRQCTEQGCAGVKRVVNANAYELELPASLRIRPVINISHLKEYRDGVRAFPDRPVPLTRPEPEALDDNGAPEWLVERLLDHRKV